MHMFMGVGVIQRKSGRGESFELRVNLGFQLPANPRLEEIIEAQPQLFGWELAVQIDQGRDAGMGQDGWTLDDHEMQANPQQWIGLRSADGIGSGRCGNHQAGSLQNAILVGLFDGFVDGLGQSKIVSGKRNGLHAALPVR